MTQFDSLWANSSITKSAAQSAQSAAEKEATWTAMLNGSNWQKKVAFVLQKPLKNKLDYVGVGRKLLAVDELPVGEIPAYDLDIAEYTAVKIPARGAAPVKEVNVKRIEIPTFSLAVNTTVKWEEIQIRRYPVFERAKERTAIAMAIAEDNEVFSLLESASTLNAANNFSVTGSLAKADFADLWGNVAQEQLIPSAFVMNITNQRDLLKLNSTDLDQVSLNVVTETGQFGVLFGTRLILSTKLPTNRVYCVTTPDKLGRIPERKAIEVKVWENTPQLEFDIIGWEQLGFGIFNTKGVARINFTRTA